MVSNWRLGEAFVICGINVQNHSTLIRKKKSKRLIMIMVIVICYWLTITINYRDTKCKTKKETYGYPLISLGYRVPLLIAEKVYQMTVESQSRRVLYSQRWVWNHHQHSKYISKGEESQIFNKNSNEMAKGPFWKWRFWRKWQEWRAIAKLYERRSSQQWTQLYFCSCEKKAWKNSGLYEIPALKHCNTDAAFYQLS